MSRGGYNTGRGRSGRGGTSGRGSTGSNSNQAAAPGTQPGKISYFHHFPSIITPLTFKLVPDCADRGNVTSGDYSTTTNSSLRIRGILERLQMDEEELLNRMYRVLPDAKSKILQACVMTAKELDASIIARTTANGFITKDGRNVIQASPPQHRGRKYFLRLNKTHSSKF